LSAEAFSQAQAELPTVRAAQAITFNKEVNMESQETKTGSIQWKWVGFSFLMYLLFYMLPIMIIGRATAGTSMFKVAQMITVAWAFGGIIVIAAVAAYFSKGVTLFEPAFAAILLIIVTIVSMLMFTSTRWVNQQLFRDILLPIIVFFVLALFGAWLGEKLQALSIKKTGPQTN